MGQSTELCARCGERERDSSHPSYCRACRNVYQRDRRHGRLPKQEPRPCEGCELTIATPSPLQRFCSRACWQRAHRMRGSAYLIDCKECGETFEGLPPRVFCSNTCNIKHYNGKKTPEQRRAERLRSNYGIDLETFVRMLAAQGGGCAICSTGDWPGRGPHVDHDHAKGKEAVRGVLCEFCNRGLGHFRDDPDLLRRAADYLEKGIACLLPGRSAVNS